MQDNHFGLVLVVGGWGVLEFVLMKDPAKFFAYVEISIFKLRCL
ncbi:hypothetical Protein YC6258_03728 [Gynuella sunshinyii YC6258]|uniref:Uncharacterized protein n=1 Tax=Gynuella sunshinyii YC6258 TaxID=1445510 RepID=A0A0C5VZD7_9GAMM|nr:hypothetical Protein YC6258_03728 [Gynuella sunshinyii YC6258]